MRPRQQSPALTPTQFVHYKAADLKGFVDTLKRGETIKFPRVHRGDHEFQGISYRAKSSAGRRAAQELGRPLLRPRRRSHDPLRRQAGRRQGRRDGEVRGGEIVGNVTRQKLVAGDVASAPAGVPHFWEVETGKSVTYMTVKLGKKH